MKDFEPVENKRPVANKVSYVIGQEVVNLYISAFNKHISGLKVWCFEMPNATYTSRYMQAVKETENFKNCNYLYKF